MVVCATACAATVCVVRVRNARYLFIVDITFLCLRSAICVVRDSGAEAGNTKNEKMEKKAKSRKGKKKGAAAGGAKKSAELSSIDKDTVIEPGTKYSFLLQHFCCHQSLSLSLSSSLVAPLPETHFVLLLPSLSLFVPHLPPRWLKRVGTTSTSARSPPTQTASPRHSR